MNIFTSLLRILFRDFTMTQEINHGNGFVQRRYSDGLDSYQVDILDDQPRTIRNGRAEYYANGGRLTGDE